MVCLYILSAGSENGDRKKFKLVVAKQAGLKWETVNCLYPSFDLAKLLEWWNLLPEGSQRVDPKHSPYDEGEQEKIVKVLSRVEDAAPDTLNVVFLASRAAVGQMSSFHPLKHALLASFIENMSQEQEVRISFRVEYLATVLGGGTDEAAEMLGCMSGLFQAGVDNCTVLELKGLDITKGCILGSLASLLSSKKLPAKLVLDSVSFTDHNLLEGESHEELLARTHCSLVSKLKGVRNTVKHLRVSFSQHSHLNQAGTDCKRTSLLLALSAWGHLESLELGDLPLQNRSDSRTLLGAVSKMNQLKTIQLLRWNAICRDGKIIELEYVLPESKLLTLALGAEDVGAAETQCEEVARDIEMVLDLDQVLSVRFPNVRLQPGAIETRAVHNAVKTWTLLERGEAFGTCMNRIEFLKMTRTEQAGRPTAKHSGGPGRGGGKKPRNTKSAKAA